MVMGNLDNQPLQQRLRYRSIIDIVWINLPCRSWRSFVSQMVIYIVSRFTRNGKTTLAHAIANHLGLLFNRVQFTSDMLPADILGISLYKKPILPHLNLSQVRYFASCYLLMKLIAQAQNPICAVEAMKSGKCRKMGNMSIPEPFLITTQNPTQQSACLFDRSRSWIGF